ncbi:putative aminopeptidase N [Toxoplasma gondii]|uniref:Putative aminopeptidase N n=2 Tax=Toxoplasma gondii TaxID=5811 RepID=A0A7J6K0L4_TOXGO|nr:putative aminopeptidase N [Toxoplasma gondii]
MVWRRTKAKGWRPSAGVERKKSTADRDTRGRHLVRSGASSLGGCAACELWRGKTDREAEDRRIEPYALQKSDKSCVQTLLRAGASVKKEKTRPNHGEGDTSPTASGSACVRAQRGVQAASSRLAHQESAGSLPLISFFSSGAANATASTSLWQRETPETALETPPFLLSAASRGCPRFGCMDTSQVCQRGLDLRPSCTSKKVDFRRFAPAFCGQNATAELFSSEGKCEKLNRVPPRPPQAAADASAHRLASVHVPFSRVSSPCLQQLFPFDASASSPSRFASLLAATASTELPSASPALGEATVPKRRSPFAPSLSRHSSVFLLSPKVTLLALLFCLLAFCAFSRGLSLSPAETSPLAPPATRMRPSTSQLCLRSALPPSLRGKDWCSHAQQRRLDPLAFDEKPLAAVSYVSSYPRFCLPAAAPQRKLFSSLASSSLLPPIPWIAAAIGSVSRLSPSPLCAAFASAATVAASTPQSLGSKMTNATPAEAAPVGASGSVTATETQQQLEGSHVVLKPTKQPVEKHRLDYKPTDFLIDFVDLDFDLYDDRTKVTSTLTMHRREQTPPTDLVLDGEDLELESVELDGNALSMHSTETQKAGDKRVYSLDVDGRLVIAADLLPQEAEKKFKVKTVVYVRPKENLQLMGLYKSGALLVTQCEAEGFRRITYFLDRPDVMSLFKVRLAADEKACPVLLSNGNMVESGKVEGEKGRHFAVFEDPFQKPCYLFALVAGDLKSISQSFTTMSGRNVKVSIFSEPEDSSKLTWALESVLKSMKWDEERFGREYDLDVFNVVCAKDFNMGAMENKGLNIFNAALLLADPSTTTDAEYQRILNVVGHEYFHNWTGNRVTCRDWFQLTLKEGLTVFRDQLFTADMCSAAVKRIEDVVFLRSRQFAEDSGPMAHPIRPETYIAMDNFYTATVYDKGAEVIRMYHTLLGEAGFRKGMDLYFKRHDGKAVTCDDFRAAMADANGRDLGQFERWYLQAGTPEVTVSEAVFQPERKKFKLTLKQRTPPTPGQVEKHPFHIPIKVGLIGKTSKRDILSPPTKVLELTEAEQTFELDAAEDCVLSFLRDFSAPVKVKHEQTDEDIAFLMAHDSDDFAKWQAAHTLASGLLKHRAEQWREKQGEDVEFARLPKIYVEAFKQTLLEQGRDRSIQAYTLRLPDRDGVAQEMEPIDPLALKEATESVRREVGQLLKSDLLKVYASLSAPESEAEESRDQSEVSRRRLRNVVLYFLTGERDKEAAALAMNHFKSAKGMTEKYAALSILCDIEGPERTAALEQFYRDAKGDPLVLDKWFAVQALSDVRNVTETVKELQKHADFTAKNPNRLRALIFSFTRNPQFHNKDGAGYALLADSVLAVDRFNPQIAARGAGAFLQWKKYDETRQREMLKQLRRIANAPGLSVDTLEIVQKALAGAPEEATA